MEKTDVVGQEVGEIAEMFNNNHFATIFQSPALFFQKSNALRAIAHLMQRKNVENDIGTLVRKWQSGSRHLDSTIVGWIGFARSLDGYFRMPGWVVKIKDLQRCLREAIFQDRTCLIEARMNVYNPLSARLVELLQPPEIIKTRSVVDVVGYKQ